MSGANEGRVVIITGAGGGIGRAEALAFARQGAKVVVNDVSPEGAAKVVDELRALGAEAIANTDSVASMEGAANLVKSALEHFGRLDVVVNNAGILRDRMLVNMSEQEWDDVVAVHLKGTFAVSQQAVQYWRERSKAGEQVDARIINTTSASGMYGKIGQSNYGAAKAGIAALTLILSDEVARYGVTVNAIAPFALTGMSEGLRERTEEEKALMAPDNIVPLVAWLGSEASRGVTGRVFNVSGHSVSVAEGWVAGPRVDNGRLWAPDELSAAIPELLKSARGRTDLFGNTVVAEQP